jgi:hypothetical protein
MSSPAESKLAMMFSFVSEPNGGPGLLPFWSVALPGGCRREWLVICSAR